MTSAPHDWLALLRTATGRFAEVLETADPHARVTYCPDWSVHDLAVHLGGVHQWAAHAVTHGDPSLEPTEPEPGALVEWYRASAAGLLDVLASTPADARAWTLDQEDRTAGFWRRRQVHETLVHTWDAEEAVGEPRPFAPAIAWDGVLEVVEVMYPRQVRLGRIEPLPMAVLLAATDVDASVRLGTGRGAQLVRDRAEVLLRMLWHRADLEAVVPDPRTRELLAVAVAP